MKPVLLFSTGCPKCRVLEAKLNAKHIPFIVNDDIEYMQSLNIDSVPILCIESEGQILDFPQAIQWINNYNAED